MNWVFEIIDKIKEHFHPKIREVDQEYAVTSGVQKHYTSSGCKIAWAREDKIQRMLKQDGWRYAYEKGAFGKRYILKVKNSPHDLVLLVKKG